MGPYMAIYSKRISELDTSDLQALLDERAVEDTRLEFKQEFPAEDKEKYEILKKLSSFANTFGGFLVIGASQDDKTRRITGLPGVIERKGFNQKINQWCFEGVAPPLVVDVSGPIPVPAQDSDRFCYVLSTRESEVAPHFLNGRRGVWIRIDEYSQRVEPRLADENELRHLFDRRKLIIERRLESITRSRKRFETYVSNGRGLRPGQVSMEVAIGPRFLLTPLCDHSTLIDVVTNGTMDTHAGKFPIGDTVSQHESVLVLVPAGKYKLQMVEATVWGMLFYGQELSSPFVINKHVVGPFPALLSHLVVDLLVYLKHASKTLSELACSGTVGMEVRLLGIRSMAVLSDGTSAPSPLDNELMFTVHNATELLRGEIAPVAASALKSVLFGLNRADLARSDQQLSALIQEGYEMNGWS